MSKKDNTKNTNGATLGEISTIRDILMGQQIHDFETKFDSLQQQLEKVEAKLTEKIKELSEATKAASKEMGKETSTRFAQIEKETESRFAQMGSETDGRIAQVEKALQDGLTDLQQLMEDSSLNDKERIGRLLMEAGNSLLKP